MSENWNPNQGQNGVPGQGGRYPYGPPGYWGAPAGAPVPPPKRRLRGCLLTGFAVVGVFAVVTMLAYAAAGGGKASGVRVESSATPGARATGTTRSAPARAVTVLTERGSGIKSTEKFTVHGDWDLHYTYDCASFGYQGNFIVTGSEGLFDDYVNELGVKGSDVTHEHDGGTMYLKVDSECSWTLKVVDVP
jgi:hypothetical protein